MELQYLPSEELALLTSGLLPFLSSEWVSYHKIAFFFLCHLGKTLQLQTLSYLCLRGASIIRCAQRGGTAKEGPSVY